MEGWIVSREMEPTMISLKVLSTAALLALVLPMVAPSVSFAAPAGKGGPGGARSGGGGGGGVSMGGGTPGPRFSGGGGGAPTAQFNAGRAAGPRFSGVP